MGNFYPVPQGAVVTSAPLCTTLRCYQKVKKTPKFSGLQLELIDLLFPATFQIPLGSEFLCRERWCGRCFSSATGTVLSGRCSTHDESSRCSWQEKLLSQLCTRIVLEYMKKGHMWKDPAVADKQFFLIIASMPKIWGLHWLIFPHFSTSIK